MIVTDIGQLTMAQRRELDRKVKRGELWKGKNLSYPKPKTCWFDALGYPNIITQEAYNER